LIFQFADHSGISISIEKGQRESEPLRVGCHCNQVQQENQQIVRLSRFRGQRFVVHDFKVDQPRPGGLLVINHIVRSCVPVGPWAAKFMAPKLMSAPEFVASRFDHSPCERALIQILPQAFPRQLVGADRFVTARPRTKTVAIEHFETLHFPPSPIVGFRPKTNRNAGHAKIQIRQISQLFTVAVALLDYDAPSTADLLGDRIDL